MFNRNWIIAATLGLAVLTTEAWSQSAAENEPRQEEGTSNADTDSGQQNDQTIYLAPALKGIEAAIRDLITEEDKIATEAKESRENRDLEAQEGMAKWAEWMFYATIATVVLTLIALFAIVRTLHHTRRAADSAELMARETREIGQAQVRAYLGYEDVKISIDGGKVILHATLKNSGNSPASRVFGWFGLVFVQDPQTLNPQDAEKKSERFSADMQAGARFTVNSSRDIPVAIMEKWKRGEVEAFIFAGAQYETVFKGLGTRTMRTKMRVIWDAGTGEASVRPTEGYDQAD